MKGNFVTVSELDAEGNLCPGFLRKRPPSLHPRNPYLTEVTAKAGLPSFQE